MTREGASWLAEELKHLAVTEKSKEDGGAAGETRRWRDYLGVMTVFVCANFNSKFVKIELTPASHKGRRVVLCAPAGRLVDGLVALSEDIFFFLGTVASWVRRVQGAVTEVGMDGRSFVAVVRGEGNLGRIDLGEKKAAKIPFTFDGLERGWSQVVRNLEVVQIWLLGNH